MIDIKKTLERVEAFDDSIYLATCLYDLAHDESSDLEPSDTYNIMEARDNILGMWEVINELAYALKVSSYNKGAASNE